MTRDTAIIASLSFGNATILRCPVGWILSVWLSKLNLEARRPQRVGGLSQRAKIGVHAEIKILGKPDIPVCRQRDGADDHRTHAS